MFLLAGLLLLPAARAPHGAAAAGPFAYITNGTSNNVSVIDTSSNTVVATIPVGTFPVGVAVNPAGTRVYVANFSSNNVSVIDTSTNTVVATVTVGTNPYGAAVNPAGTRVYVANFSSNNVSVIDTGTNTVVATVMVGTGPDAFGQFIGPTIVLATTATLVSSQNPSTVGQPVTFTATVSCPGNTPTGTVTFKDGATTLGTPVPLVTAAGVSTASFMISTLAAGSHPITASYSGDANCAASTSTVLTQAVNAAALVVSTVTLASSQNPSFVGQPVTLTATVTCSAGSPSGPVVFAEGATTPGSGTLTTTAGVSTATFMISTLAVGSHSITASYAGNATCPTATSAVLQQQVNASPAGTSGGSGAGIAGQEVTVNFGSFTDTQCTPATTYSVTIDWGDGTSSAGTVSGVCGVVFSTQVEALNGAGAELAGQAESDQSSYAATGRFTVSGQHVYAAPGSYTAVATVTGTDGLTTTLTVTVVVGRAGQLVFGAPGQLRFIGVVTLKLSTSGCGTVSGDSGLPHQPGEFVTLTATPCTGSVFVSWSGGGSGCDGRTVSQCVVVIPASDLSVTANFAPIASPAPAGSTTQALNRGCNDLLTPASMSPNTPVVTLVSQVQGTVVVSVGRYNNALHVFQFGYFSNPAAPVDFTTVNPLQSLVICVPAPGRL